MGYLYLWADAGNPQAERGRQRSDPFGGAILPAEPLRGRGMVTSISSKTSMGGVFWRGDTKGMRRDVFFRTADGEAAGIGATGQSKWLLDEVVRFQAIPGHSGVFQGLPGGKPESLGAGSSQKKATHAWRKGDKTEERRWVTWLWLRAMPFRRGLCHGIPGLPSRNEVVSRGILIQSLNAAVSCQLPR